MRRLLACRWAALAMTLTAGAGAAGSDSVVTYSGIARDLHSGAFLYRENHVLRYRDGSPAERIVLYTCQSGAAFARKAVATAGALVSDFVLDDVDGMREGIRSQGAARQMFFRSDRKAREKSAEFSEAPGLVADTGFDVFVRANWQPLLAEQTLNLDFLLPSRQTTMHFKVKHLRNDQVDGVKVEVFRLSLANILGLVAPNIDVYYSATDRILMRYVGLSDLVDSAGGNYKADIVFHLSDRKPGDESSVNAALQAPLVSCR